MVWRAPRRSLPRLRWLIVNDVTDAEHARMREKVQPVWKMFIPSVGEGLYKEVTDQLAK